MDEQKLLNKIAELEKQIESLKQSDFLYKAIIENLPFGIQIFDKNGFSYQINPKQKELLGLPNLHEGIGKFNVLNDPFAKASGANKIYERAFNGELIEQHFEYDLGLTENSWNTDKIKKIFKEYIFPVQKNQHTEFVVALLQDISAETNSLKNLKESEEKFRSIFKEHTAIKLIVDPSNGNIIDANKAATNYYGWTHDELLSMKISDINPMDMHSIKLVFEDIKTKKKNYFEFKHRIKNGQIKDVEIFTSNISISGKEYLYSIIHDISDKKKNEKLVLLLGRSVEHSPVSIVITDHSGKIEYVNPAFSRISGYSFDEVKNKNFSVLKSGFHNKEFYKKLWDTILSGEDWFGEILNKRKNGELYWINCAISPIVDSGGEVTHFISVREDINERKELEKSTRQTYELLNNLASQVPGVIYQYRLYPDGSSAFPFSSEGIYNIYEVTPEEVKEDASPVFTRIHPDDYLSIVESINYSAVHQTEYQSEFRVILPKQGLRWRKCNAKPELLSDGSTLWHGVIIDITEEKIQEELLKLKSEEINTFFDCALDLLCITDKSGNFIRLNSEWTNVLGYEIKDLEGQNYIKFVHPEDIEATIKSLSKLIKNNKVLNYANRYICKNGDYKWIEWKGYPVGNRIYASARDITEKIRINKELVLAKEKAEESERKFKVAFYTSPDSVNINKLNGEYVDINEGFTRLTGYTKEEVIGKLSSEIKIWAIPEDREKLIDALKKNEYIENLESLFRAKNGALIPALMSARIIFLKNEPHILSVTREISERKKFEKQLFVAKEKAEESDRLKSTFLQNMSHEVRTPLNAIAGFSQLISKPNQSQEKLKKFSQMINESSEKLIDIITDMIEIAQVQSQVMKPVLADCDIYCEMERIANKFKEKAEARKLQFNFINQLTPNNYIIFTDKDKLMRSLCHLLDNAVKFTEQGSVDLICNYENEQLHFWVKDTGIGISKEMQNIVFEPFRQVETGITRNYGGNGLGLSLIKAYTDMLGGKISIDSELNKGTAILLSFPFRKSSIHSKMHSINNKQYNIKTLLIVEDEFSNYQYLLALLENLNINILYAPNGLQAVSLCQQNSQIDLVLMDIKMPIMDGHTAAKLIKQFRNDMPIIAQTAYALENERDAFISVFDDYISKPISETLLHQKLGKYLDEIN